MLSIVGGTGRLWDSKGQNGRGKGELSTEKALEGTGPLRGGEALVMSLEMCKWRQDAPEESSWGR